MRKVPASLLFNKLFKLMKFLFKEELNAGQSMCSSVFFTKENTSE